LQFTSQKHEVSRKIRSEKAVMDDQGGGLKVQRLFEKDRRFRLISRACIFRDGGVSKPALQSNRYYKKQNNINKSIASRFTGLLNAENVL